MLGFIVIFILFVIAIFKKKGLTIATSRKPGASTKTYTQKQLLWTLGIVGVVLLVFSGVTNPGTTTNSPTPQTSSTTQAPAQPATVSSSSAINDASYVSYWNQCLDNGIIADYDTQWANLITDSTGGNYTSAAQDVENMQKDLASAQTTCLPQLEAYQPVTSDIAQANTLTADAFKETIPELKPILVDMQNNDNGAIFNKDAAALTGMDDYGSAKKLIQAWQAAEKVANSTSSPLADDATYVGYWNICIEDNAMGSAATDIQALSTDGTDHNYLAAINDVGNMQTDILSAQQCLPQLASYEPLTPDVMQINTITTQFLSQMSTSLNSILTDMQNADYGTQLNTDLLGMLPETASYNKARELIAAWESENPQQ